MNRVRITISILVAIPILMYVVGGNPLFSFEQVTAQPINLVDNSSTLNTITTEEIINATSPGQPVILRGIVSSEDYEGESSKPNDKLYGVELLPNRPDGSVYKGILTFTATKPVAVGFAHRLHIDNATLASIDKERYGDLYTVHPFGKGEAGTPGQVSALSIILPDYGTTQPYYSASIPFVADAVFLKPQNHEPFIAEYELYADIVQPIAVVDLKASSDNMTTNNTDTVSPSSQDE